MWALPRPQHVRLHMAPQEWYQHCEYRCEWDQNSARNGKKILRCAFQCFFRRGILVCRPITSRHKFQRTSAAPKTYPGLARRPNIISSPTEIYPEHDCLSWHPLSIWTWPPNTSARTIPAAHTTFSSPRNQQTGHHVTGRPHIVHGQPSKQHILRGQ